MCPPSGRELEAGTHAVLDERIREPGGDRMDGAPAGAVRGHDVIGRDLSEGVERARWGGMPFIVHPLVTGAARL